MRRGGGEGGGSPGPRPEAELLLLSASLGPVGRVEEDFAALVERGLDWDWLTECALKNRVVPAVCLALRSAGRQALLAAELARLEGSFRRTQFENLGFLREMLLLVEELAARGIAATPYKGPVLAATLYEDHGHREYHDLDLIVREPDLGAIRTFLAERGYAAVDDLEGEAARRHVETDCELRYRRADDGTILEIHWEILPRRHRFGFGIGETWDRLVELELGGRVLRVLGPEDLMLVLCIHGGEKHHWSRLQMIADIARLLRDGVDWGVVMQRALGIGREDTVLLGAYLAWALLDAPLEAQILARTETASIRSRAALTLARLFRLDSGLPSHAQWNANLAYLDARARARGHEPTEAPGPVSYLRAILTPDWTDRQSIWFPKGLGFLYWLYRPVRLWRLHGTALFERV